MRKLYDGRLYLGFHTAMDRNGNKVCKVFLPGGGTEIIRDVRMPLAADKFYKSLSGLYGSSWKVIA